ncbi:MAG: hypothetical protein NW206_19600 [Hyphomonadaceae bacterium]|nr:hypothetical protein [Hyphomonadaceae bacterium]
MHTPLSIITGAESLLNTAETMVSLRVPPNAPDREALIAEAALSLVLNAIMDAAKPGARSLHAVMQIAVLRGRDAEPPMDFAEIMGAVQQALMDSIAARIADEAEQPTA